MPGLESGVLFGHSGQSRSIVSRWPQFQRDFVILTYRARVGIVLILKDWNIQPGEEVLMPAYNCGTEVDSVLWSGAKVVFYRVDRRASADWHDVKSRITDRTRVLYVIHYFGWPQDLSEIAGFCKQKGIRIIEDCALCLFSCGSQGPLGMAGDAAVFSFPKTLGVPDGGVLTARGAMMKKEPLLQSPPRKESLRKSLPLIKRAFVRRLEAAGVYGFAASALSKSWRRRKPQQDGEFPDMPASYYFDKKMVDWRPSRLSLNLLAQCSPQRVVDVRRRNYQAVSDALQYVGGFEFLFTELPEGVCPLGFPLVVNDRKRMTEALNQAGIAAMAFWQGYHRGMTWDEFPEARFLKDHLLVLPIHQQMALEHIGYMTQCVKALS